MPHAFAGNRAKGEGGQGHGNIKGGCPFSRIIIASGGVVEGWQAYSTCVRKLDAWVLIVRCKGDDIVKVGCLGVDSSM